MSLRVLAFVVAFLFCIPGCSEKQGESTTPSVPLLQKLSIRLAWVPDMAEAGVFVARHQGHFAAVGVDMTIESGGFGLDPIKLVASGSNDYGVAGAGNVLLARAQGVPVVAIAAEFQNTPVGFVARADAGISDFASFKGKRIGVQTGADTDVLYRALLARFGMSSSDVKEIPIQFDMSPFVNNLVDVLPAYITNQPITLKSRGIETTVISAKSQGVQYYGNVFFTTEERIASNPDQVQRVVSALLNGWQEAISSSQISIEALKANTQDFDDADLPEIHAAVVPFIQPDEDGVELLGMTRKRWDSTASVLTSAGMLEGGASTDGAYTLAFIDGTEKKD